MARHYPISEQENYIKEVDNLLKGGMTQANALKQIGISQTAYYNWKRRLKGREAQIQEVRSENTSVSEQARLLLQNNILQERVNRLESLLGKLLIERELSNGG